LEAAQKKAAAQKKRKEIEKDDIMKAKQELSKFYKTITNSYLENYRLWGATYDVYDYFGRDHSDVRKMEVFIKLSGLSVEQILEMSDKIFKKYVKVGTGSFSDIMMEGYSPLYVNKRIFNKIINNKSFVKTPTVKKELKDHVERLDYELEAKTEYL
jgi:hypothetical protein